MMFHYTPNKWNNQPVHARRGGLRGAAKVPGIKKQGGSPKTNAFFRSPPRFSSCASRGLHSPGRYGKLLIG